MSENSGTYEGGQCQQQYTTPLTFKQPKPNYNIRFLNTNNEELGTLDFNGPALTFEGNADMSAMIFIDWAAKRWSERLKEEYERGVKDGKSSQTPG